MEELILYKNELKNKKPSRYKMIGIVSELILSNELFKKNKDISLFLYNVFGIEYKEYIMQSRTLIVARVVRHITKCSEKEYLYFKKNLYKFIDLKLTFNEDKNLFDGWIKN